MDQMHATTVAIDGRGILLLGPSGSGKSDLALRLIDDGARLVADDRTVLVAEDGEVIASPPVNIAGKMELRGFGVVPMPFEKSAPVVLVVKLAPREEIPRLPDPMTIEVQGKVLPMVMLDAQDASAVARVNVILKTLHQHETDAR
ncbi:HPr kinase/phosphorylase [Aestuariispira ectoiniformans]|uniref:HPr kinase/phosphorylase n=1 Tax=Aestuariispira ectoiniformans TaxID=2775080 RepID=UPI00223A9DE5|nr:serine/threonine protein kinase [Aestuariispira ectoiniformans]